MAQSEPQAAGSQAGSPPYIAFRTFLNLVERMEREGVPARIDKTYLDNLAGGYQGQVFTALRSLGLMGEDYKVLTPLRDLVEKPEHRPMLVGLMVERTYPYAVALGVDATHGQLEEAFKENAPTLGTAARTKAITFYMHAAKFAGMSLSKHFKGVSTASGGSPRRRVTTRRRAPAPPPPPPAGPSQAAAEASSNEQRKEAYFKLLLGLADASKAEGEVNTAILDRIEKLLASGPGEGGGEPA
jgi:hypothetical protein